MTQKELDAVQSLLEKEREAHEKTKKEFEKLKVSVGSVNES
jgi:predicted  nucleic acid-binding Zn-ribbon protein